VFTIVTSLSPGPADRKRRGPMDFLGWPKFAGLIAVISAVIGLLAYVGDMQERRHKSDQSSTASAGSSARPTASTSPSVSNSSPTTPPSTATSGDDSSKKVSGTGSFALATRKADARTVEVDVTPPAKLTDGRVYWFFIEIDWRDGNTDYYPRERLTGGSQSLVVDIPPDARLDAGRAGRVYALTAAQSTDAEVRLNRQRTSKEEDFFPEKPGAAASAAVKLPFGD
jgi:hypothetical protein